MSAELQHLQLSDEEKKVYLQIVAFSQLSLEELASYTNLDFSDLEKILDNLLDKKYISKIDSLNRYVCKFPFIDTINEFSMIISDLKSISEELEVFKKNQIEKFYKEQNQRKEQTKNELNSQTNSLLSLQSQLNEKYNLTYESIVKNVNKEHEEISGETKQLLSDQITQFKSENTEFSTIWLEKFQNLIKSAFNTLNELQNELTSQIETFDSKTTTFISEFIESITTEISQLSSNSNEIISQSLITSQSSSEESNNKLSSSIGLLYTSFNSFIEKMNSQFQNLIHSNQKSLDDITTEQNSKIDDQLNLEFSAVEEKISTYLNEINQKSTTALAENIDNQTTVKNNFLKEIEESLVNYDESLTQTNELVVQKLNQQFETYKSEDNSFISNLIKNKDTHIESTKESITSTTDITSEVINESLTRMNSIFVETFESFNSKLKEIENSISETTTSLHSQLKTKLEETLITWGNSLDVFASNSTETTSVFTSARKESVDNFLLVLQNSVKDWSIEQKEKLIYLMTSKDEKKQKFEEIGRQIQQNSVEQIKTFFEESKNDSKTKITNLKSSIHDLENERSQLVAKLNSDTFSKLSNQVENLIIELNTFSKENEPKDLNSIVELFNGLKLSLTSLHKNLQTANETSNEKMIEKVNALKTDSDLNRENFIKEMIATANSALDSGISNHKDVLETFSTNFQEAQALVITSLSETLKNLENLSISQIGKTIQNTLTNLNEVSKIQQEMTTSNTQTINDISIVGTNLIEFISEQYIAVEQNFNQTNDKLISSIKKSEAILVNKSNTLQELENKINEYSYPNNNSAPVFGLNRAKYHIEKMFSRLKSKITLFIPNPNHLPEELILSAKSSKQITIISMFDLELNKEMLKKFVENDNIQIRSLESSVDVPPFIGCDRDAEESLFGSYEKQEFIGMHTTQKEFIELIGKRLISSFSPLAKRISRNDFK